MIIVIFCSLLCLMLTYMESKGKNSKGMLFGFTLITILGCIHYNYGNDYSSYYSLFQQIEITPFDFKSIINGEVYRDSGWVLLCYAFIPIGGFFTLVAVLNMIQNVIIYRFIRGEISKEWWSIATFIYLFNTSFYLMNFSMMRQGFVICVFLGLWTLIKDRRWLIPLIVLFMCSLVHGSSKILIPFAFIGFLPNFSGKKFALFFVLLLLFLWTNMSFLEEIFNTLFALEDFEEYVRYRVDAGDFKWGLGVVVQLIPLFISLFYFFTNPDDKFQNKLLVSIALLSFVVSPFTRIVPGVGRVSLYFSIYSFAAIPIAYSSIKNVNIRRVLLTLYVIVVSYDYWIFFSNPVFAKSYSTFHTIFSVL